MRDKGGAFVTFVFPLIYCIFFGLIFSARTGTGRELVLLVVDEDGSAYSAAFIERLHKSDEFDVLSAERTEAIDLVRRGVRVAYVVLTHGFGKCSENPSSERRPRIEIGVDPARQLEAGMIRGLLIEKTFQPITLKSPNSDTRGLLPDGRVSDWRAPIEIITSEVLGVRRTPTNGYEISFPQGIIWGVLGCCASFVISVVIERTSGTLSRLRVAPIDRTTILTGKALACFGSTVSLGVVLFVIGRLFFGVSPQSIGHLLLSLILIAVAFVGIMMFLSTLGKTERSVSGIAWGVLLGMAMLGGGMVPRMFMPQWMQTLSHISPVRWAILAMEGSVWRDFSTIEMLTPWGILLGIGVAFFLLGAKGFAWMDER